MKHCKETNRWYLPDNVIENNRVNVAMPNGRKTWFRGVGQRKYGYGNNNEIYKHYLSPSFSILQDQDDPFVLVLRNAIYFTDNNNVPLNKRKIPSRRKHLCKAWFNQQWCVRIFGIMQFLADNDGYIRFGPEGKQQLIISAMPFIMNSSQSIDDAAVSLHPDIIHASQRENERGEYI